MTLELEADEGVIPHGALPPPQAPTPAARHVGALIFPGVPERARQRITAADNRMTDADLRAVGSIQRSNSVDLRDHR
jgi:hypothetical protein